MPHSRHCCCLCLLWVVAVVMPRTMFVSFDLIIQRERFNISYHHHRRHLLSSVPLIASKENKRNEMKKKQTKIWAEFGVLLSNNSNVFLISV